MAAAVQATYQQVVSRLTRASVASVPRASTQDTFELSLSEEIVPLGRNRLLGLLYRQSFVADQAHSGGWSARTTAYTAHLYSRDGRELIAYHWNAVGDGRVKTPHLHVGRFFVHAGLPGPFRALVNRLGKAHLPTGYVTLAEILRVTITDLGVEPLRDDWAEVLDRCERVMRVALPRQ